MVEGEGFEPSKAEPTDLQSAPFDRSGTPPKLSRAFWEKKNRLSILGHVLLLNLEIICLAVRGDEEEMPSEFLGRAWKNSEYASIVLRNFGVSLSVECHASKAINVHKG